MIEIPLAPFYVFLMVFIRASFIFVFFPLLGESFVPIRFRIILALAVSMAMAGSAPVSPDLFPTTLAGFFMFGLSEALLGFTLATIGRLLFAIVQYAGQVMGSEMGFRPMSIIDPSSSQQVTVISQLHYICAVILFFVLNIHHAIFTALVMSFRLVPPGEAAISAGLTELIMNLGAMMFRMGLQLATLMEKVRITIGMASWPCRL